MTNCELTQVDTLVLSRSSRDKWRKVYKAMVLLHSNSNVDCLKTHHLDIHVISWNGFGYWLGKWHPVVLKIYNLDCLGWGWKCSDYWGFTANKNIANSVYPTILNVYNFGSYLFNLLQRWNEQRGYMLFCKWCFVICPLIARWTHHTCHYVLSIHKTLNIL